MFVCLIGSLLLFSFVSLFVYLFVVVNRDLDLADWRFVYVCLVG